MEGKKTVLITGGNSGVGLEACKIMCAEGHKVIATVRSEEKGRHCLNSVTDYHAEADIHHMICDVADFNSVRQFAQSFREKWLSEEEQYLDVLINNAGMLPPSDKRHFPPNHPDWEVTMTTNCLGPMLLTDLLAEDLKKTAEQKGEARIVFVGSGLIAMDKSMKPVFSPDDIMTNSVNFPGNMAYYKNSKVAVMLCAQALKAEMSDVNVKVIYVCPGYVPGTNIHGTVSAMMRCFQKCCLCCCFPPKTNMEGGGYIVNMAVRKQGAKDHDLFFSGGAKQKIPPQCLDQELQARTIKQVRDMVE